MIPWIVVLALTSSSAQESDSFRLAEHTLNATGRPQQATSASSPNFRLTLEAVGGPTGRRVCSSPGFVAEPGFVPAYPPPGEVHELRLPDQATLDWRSERSVGSFDLYRDDIGSVGSDPYGECFQADLQQSSAQDPEPPPAGSAFVYLVAATNRLGEKGPVGRASDGSRREVATPCP